MVRALAREPETRDALLAELRDAGFGDEATRLLAAPVAERDARHVIERLALALAAATLNKHAPHAVSDAFAARRLHARSATFGAGDGAIDETALIERLALRA